MADPDNKPTGSADESATEGDSETREERSPRSPEGGETQSLPHSSPPPPKGPRLTLVIGFSVVAGLFFFLGFILAPRIARRMGGGEASSVMTGGHAQHGAGPQGMSAGKHEGALIEIDPVVVQNMGVRVEPVVQGPLVKTIRTVGSVEYDETRVGDVNIKVGGWIEELYVDYEGTEVEEGDPLFDLFSRELYDTQRQYLIAVENLGQKEVPFLPESATDPQALLESSRIRLEYYDVTPEQIEELRKRGKPSKTMTIVSPHTGVVIEKHAFDGMKVDPGMRLYRIADLSTVWVMVALYEYQLPYVSVGQPAVMTLSYIPGQILKGKVIYIYPYLERKTRQARVRLEFENPHQLLKLGMYARVELRGVQAGEATLVPRSAIIDTGQRQVAFVSLGDGRFEPREVRIGMESDVGLVQVLSGLSPGERVVTSGQFMLDSEARVGEALAKRTRGTLATDLPLGESLELSSLPETAGTVLGDMLDAYFEIGAVLATGAMEGVKPPAQRLADRVDELARVELPGEPEFWKRHDQEVAAIRRHARDLHRGETLASGRLAYGGLSVALADLVRATGIPADHPEPVQEVHCPMYAEGQGGALWLQPAGEIRNPFLGPEMITCYDKRLTLPATGSTEPAHRRPGDTPSDREPRTTGEHLDNAPPERSSQR